MSEHGTRSRFVAGCHCEACILANREYQTRWRRRFGVQPQKRVQSAEAMHVDPTDPRHGSNYGYKSLGCRCDRCRDAAATYQRIKMQQQRQNSDQLKVPWEAHGTLNGYGYGYWCCRCDRCCRVTHAAQRATREKRSA